MSLRNSARIKNLLPGVYGRVEQCFVALDYACLAADSPGTVASPCPFKLEIPLDFKNHYRDMTGHKSM